jgi:phosphoenolpyruvate carboxykinase (ATP)
MDTLLQPYGIEVNKIIRNGETAVLYESALRLEKGSALSDKGALVVYSGKKTGRSPKDKRIVRHKNSEKNIDWGPVNLEMKEHTFMANRERAIDYFNTREHLYVVDAFAGWDPRYRLKIRIICTRAYHALFMQNMLIMPTLDELKDFGEPDYVIFNAGSFPANRYTTSSSSKTTETTGCTVGSP